ncbi:lipopolysaccharide biosynthesis protein [Crenothrix sp.]|uniref:lipopolysaccharide biosynthesis protein n=1 Tax=Crenothrix sp. TaxID=3100433 RepID=UPI00374CA699
MTSIRKSILIVFTEKYLTLLINFIGLMLIARLLTPVEIGIYSVASAVTGVAQILRDFGVGNYLIQEKELTRLKIRTALTVMMLTSWTAGAILYFSRYYVANFYHEPAIADLIEIQCINFLLIPFSAPIYTLLNRDMQFSVLFRVNLMSTITQLVISLSLAVSGYGYLSLAWASVASMACSTLMVNANRPKDAWLLPGIKEWRYIVKFGTQSSLASIITQIAMNLNDLVLGRLLGFQVVAIYSRAQGQMYLFHRDVMEAVRKIVFPVFAKAVREDQDLLKAYLQSVNYVTVFAWPFYAFLGLYAQPIMRLMFGDQWDAAVPLVKILVFAGAIAALWSLASNALMATGHINKILRSELIVQSFRIVLICYAASVSIEMICYSVIIIYAFNLIITLKYLKQVIGLKLSQLLLSNLNSLVVSVISMVIPVLCFIYVPNVIDSTHLLIVSSIGCVFGWLVGIFLTQHPLRNEMMRLVRNNK